MTGARVLCSGEGAAAYEVHFQAGLLDHLDQQVAEGLGGLPTAVFLITDDNVKGLYGDAALGALARLDRPLQHLSIPPGEAAKNPETLGRALRGMAQANLDRASVVIALGGGVVSDLTGLAAALYRRGLPWIAVPTTLLAQVDAAIGGKTAVDLPEGKNLVGAFHLPKRVCADPLVLATLPDRDLRGGLGEVLKYAILGEPGRFENDTSVGAAALQSDPARFLDLLVRCAGQKISYCDSDPRDVGPRQKLNLGHTIGHALEAASDFAISHGEAVAIGIVAEASLAAHLGLAERSLVATIRAACGRLGLPVRAHWEDPDGAPRKVDRVRSFMNADKKRIGAPLRFALPFALGDVNLIECDLGDAIWAAIDEVLSDP